MAQNESISLRESQPPNAAESELQDVEQDAPASDQANVRQRESKRTRLCVLLGSAILQLPIWGTLNATMGPQLYLHKQALR